jgi:hypothetical protein
MDGQTDVCMLLMRLPLEAPPRPRDQQHKAQRRLTALQWRADVVLGGALPIRWPMSLVRYSTYISLVCSLIAQSTNRKGKRHSILIVFLSLWSRTLSGNLSESHRAPCPEDRTVRAWVRGTSRGSRIEVALAPLARYVSDPTLISRREIHAQKTGTVFRRQYRF